jgi:hypothetical protein
VVIGWAISINVGIFTIHPKRYKPLMCTQGIKPFRAKVGSQTSTTARSSIGSTQALAAQVLPKRQKCVRITSAQDKKKAPGQKRGAL